MEQSSISRNGLVHGYGNNHIYNGNYLEDYQMGEHFWNFLTKEESKATTNNNEEGDVEAGIDVYFHNDFRNMIVYEEAEIEIEDCIGNELHNNNSSNVVADVETDDDDDDEVEGYIERFRIEDFQDVTANSYQVRDDSYIEVPRGKPTYYSHAQNTKHSDDLDDYTKGRFYDATEQGNRGVMEEIGTAHSKILTMKMFDKGTALQETLWYGEDRVEIAKGLVKLMKPEDLKTEDDEGYNALARAVLLHHDTDLLGCIIDRNKDLPDIGAPDKIPVVLASSKGFADTTLFLYPFTDKKILSGKVGVDFLNQCISLNLFGIAGEILQLYPDLLRSSDDNDIYPTHALAKAIAALQISIVQHKNSSGWNHVLSNLMNCCCYILLDPNTKSNLKGDDGKATSADQELICEAYELLQLMICEKDFEFKISGWKYIRDAMMKAAEHGLVKFIKEMLKVNRELIGIKKDGKNMFWYAIMNRQEKVFNLIYAFDQKKHMLLSFNLDDKEKETEPQAKKIPNILHFAAKRPSSSVLDRISGPALQMQREIQWFKAVQEVTIHRYRQDLNESDKTPYALFIEEHKELLAQGEEAMKKTATAATTVGALIVTTMFAAAFSVVTAVYPAQSTPDSSSHGVKVFFIIFLVSAALSLFSCTSSIIVFLGILASRFSPEDFLSRLPGRVMVGFWALFVAIAAMMVAFCVGLHTMLKSQRLNSFIIGISVFAIVPVAGFIVYLCPLLCEICRSTCRTVFDKSTRLPKAEKKPSYEWC